MSGEGGVLPGSSFCVGCRHMTFRQRPDGLCPRCAWQAEQLIEQIELEALDRDLASLVSFEAYCRRRDRRRALDLSQPTLPASPIVDVELPRFDATSSPAPGALPPAGASPAPNPAAEATARIIRGPWPDQRPA